MKKLVRISAVMLALYFLFFFRLGERSLWDPDEPRYAEAAREMLESGDYLTPRFNYAVRFDKPPLVYWLIAASYKAFGISEFAARLWPAFFGIGCVVLAYFIGSMLKNKRLGYFSAFVLATCVEFMILARACTTDMALCFFITLAAFFFLKKDLVLSFAAIALATLTKGPAGIVLPMAIFGIFVLITRERKFLPPARLLLGSALFLVIALPWYYLIIAKHGGSYAKTFFVFHHLERFFSKEFQHAEPFYYYVPMLLGGFLPWSVFLPAAIQKKISAIRKKEQGYSHWIFLLLWAFVPVLLFSFARAKLPTYILPVFPALAIIVGDFFEGKRLDRIFLSVAIAVSVLAVVTNLWIIPRVDVDRSGRAVADAASRMAKQDDRFATYKFFKPSFVFYARHMVERLETEDELLGFLSAKGRAFVFLKTGDYEQLKETPSLKGRLICKAGRYAAVSNLAD